MPRSVLLFIIGLGLTVFLVLFYAQPARGAIIVESPRPTLEESLVAIEVRLVLMALRPGVHESVDPGLPYKDILRFVRELKATLGVKGYETPHLDAQLKADWSKPSVGQCNP